MLSWTVFLPESQTSVKAVSEGKSTDSGVASLNFRLSSVWIYSLMKTNLKLLLLTD